MNNMNDINDDSNNVNNVKLKRQFVKLKHVKFKNERIDILRKIYQILNIDENNRIIKTHLLDLDDNMQKQILELDNDIKKYFKVAAWPAYKNLNTERRYLSIIKYVFKDLGITYESLTCKLKYQNKIVNTTMYTIQEDLYNQNIIDS